MVKLQQQKKNRANEESLHKAKLPVHLFSTHLPFLEKDGETAKNKTNQMKRESIKKLNGTPCRTLEHLKF